MVADKNLCILILAGGKGTRMKSSSPKPMHRVCGRAMLGHILKTAQEVKPCAMGVLIGWQAALLKKSVTENLANWDIKNPVAFVVQKELTGSGTAARAAVSFFGKYKRVLILAGDAPLIESLTLLRLIKHHDASGALCTVLTVEVPCPKGYGRIVREDGGGFCRIVEESETDAKTSLIKEVNSGMYIFETAPLIEKLKLLKPQGPKREYYLTDVLSLLKNGGGKVEVFKAEDYREAMGINSKKQLAQAAALMRVKTNEKLMDAGVIIIDPQVTYIEDTVKIGEDTQVYPNAFICGKTVIGKNCFIGPSCWLENCQISDGAVIKGGSYIVESNVGKNCQVGPYAYLRPQSVLKDNAKAGDFVEIKKSVIGQGSKVPHLSYVGDSVIGKKVNIGAGTITCNYDGKAKHQTLIGDGAFVGSNTNFVAPVKIGRDVKIGAGSTITEDIPRGALAIARARQVNLIKDVKKDKTK